MDLIAEHIRELFDAGPDAMVVADAQGRICFVNAQTETVFGYRRDELIGQPLEMLMPEKFRAAHPALHSAYAREPRARPMGVDLNLVARHRDGSEFPVEISLSPLDTKHGLFISSAIRDVSARKQIHEQLVAARTAADEANRAKSSFLAAASHNLRQPLQTLTLLNGVLEKIVTDPTAAKAVTAQAEALDSVSSLLTALLDISKLESGAIKPDIADCSVQSIFKHLKATFDTQARAKGLSLLVDDAEHIVRTDKGLLEQIVQNLVANAIRYTRKGMVQLRCLHDAACVRIEVLDTGIGIPASDQSAIFDDFHQLNRAPGEKREGLGMGLAIVRRMAELLGHAIEVRSEPGQGSCFSVTVPQGRVAVLTSSKYAPSPSTLHSKGLILVVDDDAAVSGATKMLLKVDGHRVLVADSFAAALALTGDDAWPDVIVSDYHLENGNSGIDVISNLRSLAKRNIPAILVTGDTSSEVPKALEHLGDCQVLSKPFVPTRFLEVVNECMSGKH